MEEDQDHDQGNLKEAQQSAALQQEQHPDTREASHRSAEHSLGQAQESAAQTHSHIPDEKEH